jgi:small subunit ribosomal protein S13
MRISGITIPDEKRLEIGLSSIYGVGRARAKQILTEAGVDHGKKPGEVSESEENKIREQVEKFKVEGDLKRDISGNIKRLKDIGTYRGSRHAKGLPARGQRTKTNSRSARPYQGRKTMGSGKVKVEKT